MKHTYSKRPHKNLVQTIREAESEEEITQLLSLGGTFEDAGPKTRSRWHESAKKRRRELNGGEQC